MALLLFLSVLVYQEKLDAAKIVAIPFVTFAGGAFGMQSYATQLHSGEPPKDSDE